MRVAKLSVDVGQTSGERLSDPAGTIAERFFQLFAGLFQRRGKVGGMACQRQVEPVLVLVIGAADRFGLVGKGGFDPLVGVGDGVDDRRGATVESVGEAAFGSTDRFNEGRCAALERLVDTALALGKCRGNRLAAAVENVCQAVFRARDGFDERGGTAFEGFVDAALAVGERRGNRLIASVQNLGKAILRARYRLYDGRGAALQRFIETLLAVGQGVGDRAALGVEGLGETLLIARQGVDNGLGAGRKRFFKARLVVGQRRIEGATALFHNGVDALLRVFQAFAER